MLQSAIVRTYSTEQAAKLIDIHYVTLRRWLADGKFKPSIGLELSNGKKVHRFTEADIKRLRQYRHANYGQGKGVPVDKRER